MNLAIFITIFLAFKENIESKIIKSHFAYGNQFISEIDVYEYVTNCTIDIAITFKLNNKTEFGYLKGKKRIAKKSKIVPCPDTIQTTLEEHDYVIQQINNYISVEIKFDDYLITSTKTPAIFTASSLEQSTFASKTRSPDSMISALLTITNRTSQETSKNEFKSFLFQFIDVRRFSCFGQARVFDYLGF